MQNSNFIATLSPADQAKFHRYIAAHAAACEKAEACRDERLFALPHHRRIALFDLLTREAEFLEAFAPEAIVEAKRSGSTRHDIATTIRDCYPLLAQGVYMGRFDVLCDLALRMMVHYGRVHTFQTTDALEQMLQDTDFGADVPAAWVQLPFEDVYIEFGEHHRFPVSINDPASGDHIVEGVYVMGGLSESPTDGQLVRGFDLMICGSPVGKTTPLDDHFVHMGLPIYDEEKPISELVREVVAQYAATDGKFPNSHAFQPVVEHVAKVLVYLGTKDARQHLVTEGSDARRRLSGIKSSSKREKAQRQAARQYDRIIVGPDALPDGFAGPGTGATGSVRPHIRRGHFRAQAYGPQHSLRRPQWIQPMLVGKDRITGDLARPEYVIQ